MRSFLRVALPCVFLVAFAGPARAEDFAVAPVPRWVAPRAIPAEGPAPRPGEPVAELLVDDQYDLTTGDRAHYRRIVEAVTASAGIEGVSELSLSFDPTYEGLVIHGLRIRRGGVDRDALASATVRSYFSESSADNRIFNGDKTVLFVLRDVRVGDIVDLEYTRSGANPVFAGLFATTVPLAGGRPTAERHLRFLAAPGKSPRVTPFAGAPPASVTPLPGGGEALEWEARAVPAVRRELDAPDAYEPTPRVTVSELRDWAEVIAWATPLFEEPIRPDPTVAAAVAQLRKDHPDDGDAQALAAIRFVQDEIRYLGMEMGEHSHRPHRPKDVLTGRFGDCKDKATLLVTLLRGLGHRAHVALVNTRAGEILATYAPSPFAFNHAIVALERPGQRLWIDATESLQGGTLATMAPPDFGWALVLGAGETTLVPEVAPRLEEPTLLVKEYFARADAAGDAAVLQVSARYRGASADGQRSYLATRNRDDLQRSLLGYYAQTFPAVEAVGDVDVRDDRDANELVIREVYRIPDYFADTEVPYRAHAVEDALPSLSRSRRTSPLALRYPYFARHTVSFDLGHAVTALPEDTNEGTDAFVFRVQRDPAERNAVTFELRTLRPSIAPEAMGAAAQSVRRVRGLAQGAGRLALPPPSEGNTGLALGILGGGVAFVFAGWGLSKVPRKRRQWRWQRKVRILGGQTPATALPMASEWDARVYTAELACGCGRKALETTATLTPLRLGDGIVTGIAMECACGKVKRAYFRLPP